MKLDTSKCRDVYSKYMLCTMQVDDRQLGSSTALSKQMIRAFEHALACASSNEPSLDDCT
jgi:hypothetical protein